LQSWKNPMPEAGLTARRLEALLDRIPYARWLGFSAVAEPDRVVAHLPFREMLTGNPRLPAIHGGVVGAFLELTALLELVGSPRDSAFARPINFNVNYLRSAGARDLWACARVVKHGKRIANVEVVGWQLQEAKPVASGWANFRL
jgi:uncharacterized protein (TIGR00369 family)